MRKRKTVRRATAGQRKKKGYSNSEQPVNVRQTRRSICEVNIDSGTLPSSCKILAEFGGKEEQERVLPAPPCRKHGPRLARDFSPGLKAWYPHQSRRDDSMGHTYSDWPLSRYFQHQRTPPLPAGRDATSSSLNRGNRKTKRIHRSSRRRRRGPCSPATRYTAIVGAFESGTTDQGRFVEMVQ